MRVLDSTEQSPLVLADDASYQYPYTTSSASSAGTSSGGSLTSAYSRGSGRSVGTPQSLNRSRRRHKKRVARTPLASPLNLFQCTFCTETFRTKHDWKRHEKSLHLALETWVCAPDGPRAVNPENGRLCCVFCGHVEPNDAHVEEHNPFACQERTFTRKDHIKQHLKLVHRADLIEWSSKAWKAALPEIRSKCGFCGITMDTWTSRADHLADHFKMGQTMATWEGDWGFDDFVAKMIENSIPPCKYHFPLKFYIVSDLWRTDMIKNERNTLCPFKASRTPAESPRSAYELIALELAYFLRNYYDETDTMPDNSAVQLEACRILFASEVLSSDGPADVSRSSWLKDLITLREDITRQAQFVPIRSRAEYRLSVLKINGQKHLFESCPLESQLHDFVQNRLASGSTFIGDHELQEEACRIVTVTDREQTTIPSDFVANWLVQLIWSSSDWLAGFRQRANISLDEVPADLQVMGGLDMNEFLELPQDTLDWGLRSDDGSGDKAEVIATVTGDGNWVPGFERLQWSSADNPSSANLSLPHTSTSLAENATWTVSQQNMASISSSGGSLGFPTIEGDAGDLDHRPTWVKDTLSFLNDANFDRWLTRELRRWVKATMSPNNPNCHTPSDDELQHQARYILYDE